MSVEVDEVLIQELQQSEVDPSTNSTTIYTGLSFPDGGEGFLIVGRIQKDRKHTWKPLKEVIDRILIQYVEEKSKVPPPAQEDSLLFE
jgi:hypothetical protein